MDFRKRHDLSCGDYNRCWWGQIQRPEPATPFDIYASANPGQGGQSSGSIIAGVGGTGGTGADIYFAGSPGGIGANGLSGTFSGSSGSGGGSGGAGSTVNPGANAVSYFVWWWRGRRFFCGVSRVLVALGLAAMF